MGVFGAIVKKDLASCRPDGNDGDFRRETNQTFQNARRGKIQECGTEFRFGRHARLAFAVVALARDLENAGSRFVEERGWRRGRSSSVSTAA